MHFTLAHTHTHILVHTHSQAPGLLPPAGPAPAHDAPSLADPHTKPTRDL